MKQIDPDWEHDEVEVGRRKLGLKDKLTCTQEIMVISPKPRMRDSFLDLGTSKVDAMCSFYLYGV